MELSPKKLLPSFFLFFGVVMKKEKTKVDRIIENKPLRCVLDFIISGALFYISFSNYSMNEPFSFSKLMLLLLLILSVYLTFKTIMLVVFQYPRLTIENGKLVYSTMFKTQSFPVDRVFITKQRVVFEKYIYIKVDNKKLIFTYYSLSKEFKDALGL